MTNTTAAIDAIDAWFAEYEAKRAREAAEFQAKVLPHLQAGGVVRETVCGRPTDWCCVKRPWATYQPGTSSTPERLADHLDKRRAGFPSATYEFLPADTPPWRDPLPPGALYHEGLVAAAKAAGFNYVATLDGPLALEKWHPYGDPYRYFGELREDHIYDVPRANDPGTRDLLLGGWVLLKELPVG